MERIAELLILLNEKYRFTYVAELHSNRVTLEDPTTDEIVARGIYLELNGLLEPYKLYVGKEDYFDYYWTINS